MLSFSHKFNDVKGIAWVWKHYGRSHNMLTKQTYISHFSIQLYRYSLMMACWSKKPHGRPTFGDIVTTISNYTEVIAGYLDVNFNPFQSFDSQAVSTAASATNTVPLDSTDCEKQTGVSSSVLLRKLEDSYQTQPKKSKSPKGTRKASPKVSPKASPRASPRTSPRISPRASPLLKLKLKEDHHCSPTPGAEIEICIKSPSEDGSDTSSSGLLWMT